MVSESRLKSTEHGLVPQGEGWFVVNAREARWREGKGRAALCLFEGEPPDGDALRTAAGA